MSEIKLRTATSADFNAIVQLNASEVKWTSPLEKTRLAQLHDWSDHHKVIIIDDKVAAFLLVMPAGIDYDSLNYLWFSDEYDDFLYVDRIVVAAEYAGHKLGSRLYQDLFDTASKRGISRITCEYNIVPINKPSELFHQHFGFQQVGTQWLDNNAKQVSLQVAEVAAYLAEKS